MDTVSVKWLLLRGIKHNSMLSVGNQNRNALEKSWLIHLYHVDPFHVRMMIKKNIYYVSLECDDFGLSLDSESST